MPVQSWWDNKQKTILRNDFEGIWTWNEYFEMLEQRNALMSSVHHRVDVIADMKMGLMPMSADNISPAKISLGTVPPNHGVFVVAINTLMGTLLDVFMMFDRDSGVKLHTARSIEEAREIILVERAKLTRESQT